MSHRIDEACRPKMVKARIGSGMYQPKKWEVLDYNRNRKTSSDGGMKLFGQR